MCSAFTICSSAHVTFETFHFCLDYSSKLKRSVFTTLFPVFFKMLAWSPRTHARAFTELLPIDRSKTRP